MTDMYRIADTSDAPPADPAARARGGNLRTVLWLVLVTSTAANATTSMVNTFVGIGFGLITLGSAVALAVHYYRGRHR